MERDAYFIQGQTKHFETGKITGGEKTVSGVGYLRLESKAELEKISPTDYFA